MDTLQAVAAALETEFTEIVYGPGHIMNAELERYVRFQKKKVIVFAAAALLVVGLILRATLVHDLDMARKRTFDMTPYYIASTSVRSVIFFCLIASIPTGIALFSDIHIGNQRLRQALLGDWGRIACAACLGLRGTVPERLCYIIGWRTELAV